MGQEEPDSREAGEGGRVFVLPVALGGGKIARGGPAHQEFVHKQENGGTFVPIFSVNGFLSESKL